MSNSSMTKEKYVSLIDEAKKCNLRPLNLNYISGQGSVIDGKAETTPRQRISSSEGLTESISGNKSCFTFFSEFFNRVSSELSNIFLK